MTEQQKHLLMLLKEIDAICRKHDIVYYLAGGTLIGAIRHEGFIPWDDDADILMTKKNWHRFMKVAKTDLPKGRALGAPEVDRSYPNIFGRYIDLTTTAIHKNQILYEGHAGTVIDIFQLDPIPDHPKSIRRYRRDITLYSDLINECSVYSHPEEANRIRYPLFRIFSRLVGRERILAYLEKRMFSYSEEDCRLTILRWGCNALISEKEYYGNPLDVKFEDTLLMAPEKPIEYLTWHYGDEWMYIPHHNEQEGHLAVYSRDFSYDQIQSIYMPLVGKKRLRRIYLWKKMLMIQLARQRHRYFDLSLAFAFSAAKAELEKKIREEHIDVRQLFEQGAFGQLKQVFETYFTAQLHAASIGRDDFAGAYRYAHPKIIDIDPSLQIIALYTLVHTEQVGRANALLAACQRANGVLTAEQQQVKDVVNAIRQAVFAYHAGETDRALRETNNLLRQYPKNITLLKQKVRILLERAADPTVRTEVLTLLDRLEPLSPDDGELAKYRGDCDYYAGQTTEAYQKYCLAMKTTKNGLIHLALKRICKNNARELIALTETLQENGEPALAAELFQMATKLLPSHFLYLMRGFTLRLKQCETFSSRQALLAELQDMRQSLDLPERAELDQFVESVWRADGLPEAILPLKRLVWNAPISAEAFQKAKAACQEMAEKEPNNGDIIKLQADLHLIHCRQDHAFYCYRKAGLLPHCPYTHNELVWIYQTDLERFEKKYYQYRDLQRQLSRLAYEWHKKHISLKLYIFIHQKLGTAAALDPALLTGDYGYGGLA